MTQTSSVGPNTADILEWLITTYTTYGVDRTSFDHVKAAIDNYPMNFPILERKNILQTLEEIAFQARCTIFLRNDTFFLKYLAEDPTSVATITEDDVEAKSLQITHTPTEDLITRFTSTWKYDYARNDPNLIIQRHNLSRYGLHPLSYDFYCYNIQQLVEKSTTFWLIRKANTWRRIVFTTALKFLNVETYDCVTINLPDFAPGSIKCIVERADYDSASNRIKMEVWTPVLSGQQVTYDFAYPADVDENAFYPTIVELQAGRAGAGFTPGFLTAAPINHPLSDSGNNGLFQGATLAENGCLGVYGAGDQGECPNRPDFGDRQPSDRGDKKPKPDATSDPGAVTDGQDPTNLANLELQSKLAALQDAVNRALEAAQEAQATANAANEAAQGKGSSADGSGEEDPETGKKNPLLKDLPTKEQLKQQMKDAGKGDKVACLSTVCIGWFPVTTIVLFGLPICVPAGPSVTECMTFNSSGGAQSFASAAESKSQDLTAANGADCSPPMSQIVITPAPGTCQEGDGSMVAYDRTASIGGTDVPTDGPSITDPGFTNVQ